MGSRGLSGWSTGKASGWGPGRPRASNSYRFFSLLPVSSLSSSAGRLPRGAVMGAESDCPRTPQSACLRPSHSLSLGSHSLPLPHFSVGSVEQAVHPGTLGRPWSDVVSKGAQATRARSPHEWAGSGMRSPGPLPGPTDPSPRLASALCLLLWEGALRRSPSSLEVPVG